MAERRYRRYYIGAGTTLVALFLALHLWGLQIIDLSGDVYCTDVCTSYFDVRNPTYRSIYIYNKDEVKMDFVPQIKDYQLYVKYYGKWVPMDFTLETRLGNVPKDRIYTFVFPRYSIKHFKLVGYKNPGDTIKWGFGFSSEYLDPIWLGFFNVLDGVNDSRTYEYQTTVNITANVSDVTYIDILDNTFRYRNQSSDFNYTIDLLRINKFDNTNTSKNISSGSTGTITIDNRTDLYNASFNITGYNSPKNITLNASGEIINFPGILLENNLYQNEFIFSGVSNNRTNLSFVTAGSETIFINFSNQGNYLTREGYLNFTITAFDLDVGNDFDFKDNFSNDVYINISSLINISAPNSNLDDLEDLFTNSTDYYAKECSSDPGDDTCDDCEGTRQACIDRTIGEADDYLLVKSRSNCDSNNCNHISTVSLIIEKIRLKQMSFFNLTADRTQSAGGSGGYHLSSISIIATDGTTDKLFWTSSGTQNQNGIFLNGNTTNGFDWNLYQNDTLLGTVDISSLASPVKLKIKVVSSTATDFAGPETATSRIKIYNIDTSGIRLNRNNGSYEINVSEGCFESNTLTVGTNNIARVFISLFKDEPIFTNINFFTSNDNGTNYESFTPDTFHTFTTSDTDLKVKFCLNSTNTSVSPSILNYRVQIIPAPPVSLIIDVGLDGSDAIFDFELNSSTTPLQYNGNDIGINRYINRSCQTGSYCVIPISFILGSGGIIEISNFNLTENIDPIRLNISPIQTLSSITLSPTYTGGTVQFDDLRFDFRGSKNITVVAHNGTYANSLNRTIFVKYSPFNLSLLSGIDYFEVFYSSRNQSNVEPYGQNSTHGIFQIQSEAYDGNIDVYSRYNSSPHVCLTSQEFKGQNFSKIILFDNETTDSSGDKLFRNNSWYANNFTMDGSILQIISVQLKDTTSSTSGVTIVLYNDIDGSPGEILKSKLISDSEMKSSYQWFNLTFNIELINSSQYWIGFTTLEESPNYYFSGYGGAGTVVKKRSTNKGTTWVDDVNGNFFYRVYSRNKTSTSINLTISNKKINEKLDTESYGNIWAYSMINCSAYSFMYIPFQYFCFSSLCSECVITSDFTDDCEGIV